MSLPRLSKNETVLKLFNSFANKYRKFHKYPTFIWILDRESGEWLMFWYQYV